MTPNLYVASKTLFKPHKWFRNTKPARPARRTEHWDEPTPGTYEYIPGRGWYLIATYKCPPDADVHDASKEGNAIPLVREIETDNTVKMTPPVPIVYSRVLKRNFLAPDYEVRKKTGKFEKERGKTVSAGFFRLDDGVAWVNCWDDEGQFIPGPYKLWCIDAESKLFRHMRRGDDPAYQSSRATSHRGSVDDDRATSSHEDRRRSQESRSTEYRNGTLSVRDAHSLPSTRANSIAALTTPSMPGSNVQSQVNSRRNSLTRAHGDPSLALNEARKALEKVASAAPAT